MSLRRRLVVGMLVLLVAGLLTTDLFTSSSLRSFLLGRLDEQIDASQSQAYGYISQVYKRDVAAGDRAPVTHPGTWLADLSAKPTGGPSFGGHRPAAPHLNGAALAARVSDDSYVEVLSSTGKVLLRVPSGLAGKPDPAPALPRVLPVQHVPAPQVFGRNHGPYAPESPSIDVPPVGSGGTDYRVHAVAVPGGILVTAISLDPTEKTLASLTHIELFVSVGVLVALLALALWIVRIGMRPLDDMTETAGAIAGGDLTRRIRRTDDRSEVGRLGTALNGMLSQIEAAFRERTSSEARLRRFVADASHELRTPLTSIRGYAELLRKGAFDTEEERRRAAERIEGEASRMGLLVDDLLLLARLDQGRPLALDAVDLCRVVADAVDAARTKDRGRPVTLEMQGPVWVKGDAARLRQIVDNLMQNAAVHTPAATPVHVEVVRHGPDAVLRVADEGPGLDAEQAARVFDRFYRGSEARTGEGTGLGLSIVAALADAHGGRARVDTAPGAGAVFVVEIPAAASEEHERGRAARWLQRTGNGPGPVPVTVRSILRRPFVVDRGRGAPVLFVHGQPGLGSDWNLVIERLADHRVLVVDRPGYGASGDETLSIEGNAGVLAELVVERAAAPVTVVGHSYGGGVAVELAAHRPELVSGLVLVGSIGRADSLNVLDRVLALPGTGEALSAAGLFTLGRVLPRIRHAVGSHHHVVVEWLRASLPDERYLKVSARRGRQVWRSFVAEQRSLVREIGAVEAALVSVRVPTTVISGAWDLVVPPSVSASIAAAIPGSELVSVARTGHFVPRDAPDVVACAVRRVESRATERGA